MFFSHHAICAANSSPEAYKYVINLSSSDTKEKTKVPNSLIEKFQTYQIKVKIKNKIWYKSRLGFFTNKRTANNVISKLQNIYPDSWIDHIKKYDKKYLKKWTQRRIRTIKKPKTKRLSIEKQTILIEKAKQYIIDAQYQKAIPIFRKIYQAGSGYFRQEALELLGVCRERNGQLAHAVAEYRTYLKQYKTDMAASHRVKQRLNALLTANNNPKKALTKDNGLAQRPASWQYYGALFQFYDKNEIDISSTSTIVSVEQLTTNVSFSSRLIDSDYKIKTQFNAIHGYDIENEETTDERITRLYIDVLSPSRTYSVRAGRQRSSSNGAQGRFDGFDFGYRFNTKAQVKLVTGYPVEINPTVEHHDDKYFTSLGLYIQPVNKYIDYNIYVLEQIADGLIDRNEIGLEFRYRHPKRSLVTLYDYSTQYKKTNYFVTIFNWKYPNNSSINVYLDYRQSPFLSTTNALQGQVGVSTLGDLLQTLSEDEIEQLSKDRSAISKSMTIKYSIPQNEKIKYQTDFSVSSLSGTISSGGVAATQNPDNEYSLAFSLLGKKWLMKYDNYLLRVRKSQLATSDADVIDISARYRFNKTWRFGPRLRFDNRDYDDGRKIKKDRTSFRLDYKYNKSVKLELDFSVENKTTTSPTATTQDETDNIIHFGYIYTF